MPDTRLPPDMQSLLDAELRPSETVLWAAQALPERWARPNMLFGSIVGALINRLGMMPHVGYCITNRRAMILSITGVRPHIRSLEPDVLRARNIVKSPNGMDDIIFPNAPMQDTKSAKGQVGFYGIADARAVDDLIGRTFDGTPPTKTP